jgi:hypothetical protein
MKASTPPETVATPSPLTWLYVDNQILNLAAVAWIDVTKRDHVSIYFLGRADPLYLRDEAAHALLDAFAEASVEDWPADQEPEDDGPQPPAPETETEVPEPDDTEPHQTLELASHARSHKKLTKKEKKAAKDQAAEDAKDAEPTEPPPVVELSDPKPEPEAA